MNFNSDSLMPATCSETVSGRYVDMVNPDPYDINLEDIAWSLSRQARYAGHTLGEPYSVAQHACLVENLIERALIPSYAHQHDEMSSLLAQSLTAWLQGSGIQIAPNTIEQYSALFNHGFARGDVSHLLRMHALCHDNTEAYLVDLPSPAKRNPDLKKPYMELEQRFELAIYDALGLPSMNKEARAFVVWADMMALAIEAGNLMPSRARGWGIPVQFDVELLKLMPSILPWRDANKQYLRQYRKLARHLGIENFEYRKISIDFPGFTMQEQDYSNAPNMLKDHEISVVAMSV